MSDPAISMNTFGVVGKRLMLKEKNSEVVDRRSDSGINRSREVISEPVGIPFASYCALGGLLDSQSQSQSQSQIKSHTPLSSKVVHSSIDSKDIMLPEDVAVAIGKALL